MAIASIFIDPLIQQLLTFVAARKPSLGLSQQIEAVYKRALLLRDRAQADPVEPSLIDSALNELYFVLEELHTADEEIRQQNAELTASYETIEEERQRYRALFELAPDAYLVTDHQGLIHRANQATETLLLRARSTLIGKPLVVLVAADNRSQLLHQLEPSQQQQTCELTLTRSQGDPIVVAAKTTWLTNPRSQSAAILWLLRDITEHTELLQDLQATTDMLEQQMTVYTAELARVQAQLQTEIAKREQLEQALQNWQN